MSRKHQATTEKEKGLIKEAGKYLQRTRERNGVTQVEVLKALGKDYPSFISQVENGWMRLPPEHQLAWAKAIKADPYEFVKTLLKFYDPHTFDILFGRRA